MNNFLLPDDDAAINKKADTAKEAKSHRRNYQFLYRSKLIVLCVTHLVCFFFGQHFHRIRHSIYGRSLKSITEPLTEDTMSKNNDDTVELIGKSVWDVLPMEHTKHVDVVGKGIYTTDALNPFSNYMRKLYKKKEEQDLIEFPDLPLWHTWIHYFEGYHNHFHRFRNQPRVVFMEIGVYSGGKIALLRDYFGPGFEYIGLDINPSTKRFESSEWVNIEIGDSTNTTFLAEIKSKYPHVDIFLDDGGHKMNQQKIAMMEMLPHVQPEGVYICEDLSTSWSKTFGGVPNSDARHQQFLDTTFVGMIHKSLDWFMYGWISGSVLKYAKVEKFEHGEYFDKEYDGFWRTIPEQVKHIHYYNQMVVYEKGVTAVPKNLKTVGYEIPYKASGEHPPVDWETVTYKLSTITKSTINRSTSMS